MARKKFTPKAAQSTAKPIEFELYDEVFAAKPHLQGYVILNFIEATRGDDTEGSTTGIVSEVLPFFKAALEPESYERFSAIIHSDDKIVEFEDLMEILGWLVQEYTDRPSHGSEK